MSKSDSIIVRTKDINEAAFLWSQSGAELVAADSSGSSLFFKFKLPLSEKAYSELNIAYVNGKCLVDPIGFCEKIERCRHYIHSFRRTRPQH